MAENFDLIFGQNASQQYAWNDTDYQNGWGTIGNIPPTAAQFDALQRRSDMKTQELNSRLANVEQSIAGGGGQKREPDTEYTVGTIKTYDDVPFNWVLECIVGGTSGSVDITIPSPAVEGARIIDGTVTWALRKIATYGGIGYRQSSTACPAGTIAFSTALPAGWYLEATTGGTTSASDLVITSPSVGDTVTDGTVVWTIRSISAEATTTDKGLLSPSDKSKIDNIPASGGTGFNHREVITTSGTWTAPTSGYYKVTCIGGGGGGGAGGASDKEGGAGGGQGGTTSFGTVSAIGGSGGGGGSAAAVQGGATGGGGGGAGTITVGYIKITSQSTVTAVVGGGGTGGTGGSGSSQGGAGVGPTAGGVAATLCAGLGAAGACNGGCNFEEPGTGGAGGLNGTGYGGGGGGGAGCEGAYAGPITSGGAAGDGAQYGENFSTSNSESNPPWPTVRGGNGGDGGNGAIIIEYFLAN